jgi:hypothetical protein
MWAVSAATSTATSAAFSAAAVAAAYVSPEEDATCKNTSSRRTIPEIQSMLRDVVNGRCDPYKAVCNGQCEIGNLCRGTNRNLVRKHYIFFLVFTPARIDPIYRISAHIQILMQSLRIDDIAVLRIAA